MSTFFPLRPCLGCWPVVGVGEMGVGMREGSDPLWRSVVPRGFTYSRPFPQVSLQHQWDLYLPLARTVTFEFPLLAFVANTGNSLQFLYVILLTTDGREWSAARVFATLYFQCLSFWVPRIISLWTDVVDSYHTQIKKTPLSTSKDKHLTSPWIIPSIKKKILK